MEDGDDDDDDDDDHGDEMRRRRSNVRKFILVVRDKISTTQSVSVI